MKKYLLKNVSQKKAHWLLEKYPTLKFENIIPDNEVNNHICSIKGCGSNAVYMRTSIRHDMNQKTTRYHKYCELHLDAKLKKDREIWQKRKVKIEEKYGKKYSK